METEIWKDILWYEWLYQVSNFGNLKSLNYKRLWIIKLLKQQITRDWYKQIELSNNKKRQKYYIHRLVAIAFIKNLENKSEINHKDWNKENNCINNLEWNTQSENRKHCVDVLWKNWKSIWKYDLKWNLLQIYNSAQSASLDNNLHSWSVWKVCKWQRKTAWWYTYKFI